MSESECINANWSLIGFQDGVNGRPSSRLNEHNNTCSKHGIFPETQEYMIGYQDGIRNFCTPERGYEQGKAGRAQEIQCPDDLKVDFLNAYNHGYQYYLITQDIRKIESRIKKHNDRLSSISREIQRKEFSLERADDKGERAKLINEIRHLRDNQRRVENDKRRDERELSRKKSARYPYSTLVIY
ncbi:DUF2799 domain-containing protein [Thaumasiovibrio subtropicus]|uniref:DUF2799 domain-containing protein n=1 Tax=Thaumasiovibrio subtropicus TaxID=1891207 RepID=UPI00131C8B5F|nr:DUF2799 domain-containing protein [Thaumasiovibrio subtropicus]